MGSRFAYVVEQTFGHAAHSRNLERFLAGRADVETTVIRIGFEQIAPALRSLAGLRSWSLRARLPVGRNDILFGKANERVAAESATATPRHADWSSGDYATLPDRRLWPAALKSPSASHKLGWQRQDHQRGSTAFNLNYWLGGSDELGSSVEGLCLAGIGKPPGLLSQARSALPIGSRTGRA